MVDQTQITNGRSRSNSPPRRVARNVSGLAHDMVNLAELQAQLFVLDAKQAGRRAILPMMLLMIGTVFALSAVPVAILGVAYVLIEYTILLPWAALLVAAAGGAVIGGVVALAGAKWFTGRMELMKRSKIEFQHNLKWVKSVLRHDTSLQKSSP